MGHLSQHLTLVCYFMCLGNGDIVYEGFVKTELRSIPSWASACHTVSISCCLSYFLLLVQQFSIAILCTVVTNGWHSRAVKKPEWSSAWWHSPLFPALSQKRQISWGQPDLQRKFQDSQGCIDKPCLKRRLGLGTQAWRYMALWLIVWVYDFASAWQR